MKILKIIVFTIFIFTQLSGSEKNDYPTPKGFEWSNSGPNETNFLLPKNWFLKIEKTTSSYRVMISKEEIKNGKNFLTGLTVNVIKGVSKKQK